MYLRILLTFSLLLHRVLSDTLIQLPSPITHDPAIVELFSKVYSIAGPSAPTDADLLNQTRTRILALLSDFSLPEQVTAVVAASSSDQRLYCETSWSSPAYADVASAISQLYHRAGQECNSNYGCEGMQAWGSAEIGICGPFGYSWDCKDVGGMAFWISAHCMADLGTTRVGGRYLFDRWWTGDPADVRIYRRS
ncbi:hypothetical protein L873DRAFT_1787427 [Choiromyces venosus 120613-1]|uniref:Uncharacterized protein n=1 Tax=Choiromyces venosus 120613-1 TaxID=1336337 RepID=A0A3N4K0F5_9PEZI|nr:hypothetical protein L873DRAFT_1787427 [Choiromyces venosus 120613-1]